MCKRDIAARVQSQQVTIVRLQQELAAKNQEIESLRNGDGPIRPILLRKMSTYIQVDDKMRKSLMSKEESVYDFMARLTSLVNCVKDELYSGEHYDFLSRGRPV